MRATTTMILFSFYIFGLGACSVAGVSHPSGASEIPMPDAPLTDPAPNVPEGSEPDPKAPVLVTEPIEIPEPQVEEPPPEEISPEENTPNSELPSRDTYTPIGSIDETPTTPPAIIIAPDDAADVEVDPSPNLEESDEHSGLTDYELIPTPENIDNLIGDINPDLTEDFENPNDYFFDDSADPDNISVGGSCKGKDKIAVVIVNTKSKKKKHQSVKCKDNQFIFKFIEKQANRKHLKIQILYFD